MGLALSMVLEFYDSVAKGLKLKIKKFLGLISTFVEVTEEKLEGSLFGHPPSWIGLSLKSAIVGGSCTAATRCIFR